MSPHSATSALLVPWLRLHDGGTCTAARRGGRVGGVALRGGGPRWAADRQDSRRTTRNPIALPGLVARRHLTREIAPDRYRRVLNPNLYAAEIRVPRPTRSALPLAYNGEHGSCIREKRVKLT